MGCKIDSNRLVLTDSEHGLKYFNNYELC